MAEHQDVWAFAEKPALLAELLGGAQTLAQTSQGKVVAVVLGPREAVDQAASCGAQVVLWLGELKEGQLVDDIVPTLAEAMEQDHPYALLVGATRRGRAIAGRLSAHFNVTALTDVLEFMPEDGQLAARHLIFGGGAVRVDRALAEPVIATVGPGTFEPRPVQAGAPEVIEVPWIEPVVRAKLRERKTRPVAAVNLSAAKRVVCAGRGLAQQEDLSLINDLAKLLGAEVACSRPLAEGLDWLPRERYIGISGATVRPDLYLGVGVSGQVQHMIGMSDSRIVVAINKDQGAPLVKQADYAILDDLYNVVPALIKALKNK